MRLSNGLGGDYHLCLSLTVLDVMYDDKRRQRAGY